MILQHTHQSPGSLRRKIAANASPRWLFLLAVLALTLPIACAKEPDNFKMMGWAATGKGTTGGSGGKTVKASTPEQLVEYLGSREPLVIVVEGTIDLARMDPEHPEYKPNARYRVESNKTIIGGDGNAQITRGDLRIDGASNVIIRNIRFSNAPDTAVGISGGATRVWIDHNEFSNAKDGLLDITQGADLITVSWNRFSDHNKVSLVGASDENEADRGRLRVTFHHNWFDGTRQRHPRVRYGKVHLFNNYFTGMEAYAIGVGVEAQIVSEANYIDGARRAWRHYDTPEQPGYLMDSGSVLSGIVLDLEPTRDSNEPWSPADVYPYTPDPVEKVPAIVRQGAGVGVIRPLVTD